MVLDVLEGGSVVDGEADDANIDARKLKRRYNFCKISSLRVIEQINMMLNIN